MRNNKEAVLFLYISDFLVLSIEGRKEGRRKSREEGQPGCPGLGTAVLSRGWRHSGGRWGKASWASWTSNIGLNEIEAQRVWQSKRPDVRAAVCRENQAHAQMMASESSGGVI